MNSRSDQVVIVGAGIAGLLTAYELQQRGIPSTVLEADHRVGGRVGSVTFADGLHVERHLEELWESNPVVGLLRRFGVPLVEHTTQSSFLDDGELHLVPRSGRCTFVGPQWLPTERAAFARWNRWAAGVLDDLDEATTTGRWTDRLVGLQRVDLCRSVGGLGLPDAVATWIRLTVEAETGVEWDRIAALDGVDDLRPFLVDEDGRARDRSFSVAGGNERLIAELVDRLPSGTVLTGATVRQVVDDGDGVHVTYRLGSGAERCERGRWAVLTAPVWTLREIDIRPALSPEAQAAIMSTASGSYVKVVLRLARGAEQLWDRYDGRLFTLLSDALPGCVYVRDGRSAGCDHVLTALVHGAYARGLHELPDHLIVSSVVSGLQSLRERVRGSTLDVPILPGLSEWITEARVVDCPRAIAYWPQALRRSRFDHLAESLRRPHGRVLIGGDSTECSHSDGAARAALRLAPVDRRTIGIARPFGRRVRQRPGRVGRR